MIRTKKADISSTMPVQNHFDSGTSSKISNNIKHCNSAFEFAESWSTYELNMQYFFAHDHLKYACCHCAHLPCKKQKRSSRYKEFVKGNSSVTKGIAGFYIHRSRPWDRTGESWAECCRWDSRNHTLWKTAEQVTATMTFFNVTRLINNCLNVLSKNAWQKVNLI